MKRKTRRLLPAGIACSIVIGLSIASCSHDPLTEEVEEVGLLAESKPKTAIPAAGYREAQASGCAVGECAGEFFPPVIIQEFGQNRTHLYVALKDRSGGEANVTAPNVTFVREDCTAGHASANVLPRAAGVDPSWVQIPLAELPEGEVTLRVAAMVGSRTIRVSLPIKKIGNHVRYLDVERRHEIRRVKEFDANTGRTRTVMLIEQECDL